jgi:hypothetical protein
MTDSTYEAEDLPSSVKRYVKKLLRDYNFPKSVQIQTYQHPVEGSQNYALPEFFKRDLQVVWMDDTNPVSPAYGAPLRKRESFIHPDPDGISRYYWLQGAMLWTDISVPAGSPSSNLILVHQNHSIADNMQWMLDDFEDILFSLSMMRLSGELSKPELAKVWAALWQEDQKSIAIYLNELEFANLDMVQRETGHRTTERYPA